MTGETQAKTECPGWQVPGPPGSKHREQTGETNEGPDLTRKGGLAPGLELPDGHGKRETGRQRLTANTDTCISPAHTPTYPQPNRAREPGSLPILSSGTPHPFKQMDRSNFLPLLQGLCGCSPISNALSPDLRLSGGGAFSSWLLGTLPLGASRRTANTINTKKDRKH